MATVGTAVTLSDHAKRLDPQGKIPKIVELLSQTNEVLDNMAFIEGNLPTGNRSVVRTGLPDVYWRLVNQGVSPSKSTTRTVDDQCGILESWAEVDQDVAELNGDVNAFRLSEAQAFLEAMGQEWASTFFYGNSSTAPEEFNGMSVRYSSLSAENAENIIVGGGAGADNSSIWLIVSAPESICGVYPKGSKSAGIMHEDLGLQTISDATGVQGAKLRVYQDRFKFKSGITVKDWRYAVRICNIDISNLVSKSSAADLIDLMIKAIHRIPNLNKGKAGFYMNRSCFQMLDIQRRDDMVGSALKYEEVDGKMLPTFRGIPLYKCDALLETEAVVS